MMNYTFKSRMADDIAAFLRLKRVTGHDEESYFYPLVYLDRLCLRYFPSSDTINKEIADVFKRKKKSESSNESLNRRLSILKGLAEYQRSIGKDAYLCEGLRARVIQDFIPYLPTDDELSMLFKAIDSFPCTSKSDTDHIVAPVLFRLMYTCALRPGEVTNLLKKDIDFSNRMLHIRMTKTRHDRLIPFHDDMLPLLKLYEEKIGKLEIDSPWFFHNACGKQLNEDWIKSHIRRAREKAGLKEKHGVLFRAYDLRHAAASRIVMRWQNEDGNIMGRVPYLMAYMGHVDLDSTLYYVSVIPEQFYGKGIVNIADILTREDANEMEEIKWW